MTRLFTHVLVLTTLVGLALSQFLCRTNSHCNVNGQNVGGKCVYLDYFRQSWRRCTASSWWCICRRGCLLGDQFLTTEIPSGPPLGWCACGNPVDNAVMCS